MKKIVSLLAVLFLGISLSFGQRSGYVDTDYVLNKLPKYKKAQEKLDVFSKKWQAEIEAKFKEVEQKYQSYQNEKPLLSDDMKRQREEEIIATEKAAKDLQKKYFGREGEMHKKRQELVKPIQEQVAKAIKEIAEKGRYMFIHDASTGTLLYANPKANISDDVLKKLGHSGK